MPSMSGILRSVSTTSKDWRASAASACARCPRRSPRSPRSSRIICRMSRWRRLVVDDEEARLHDRGPPRSRASAAGAGARTRQPDARVGARAGRSRARPSRRGPPRSCRTRARPRPTPVVLGREVGLERVGDSSADMPWPVSETDTQIVRSPGGPSSAARSRSRPPFGMASTALIIRFRKQVLSSSGSATIVGSAGLRRRARARCPGRAPCGPRAPPPRARRRPRRRGAGPGASGLPNERKSPTRRFSRLISAFTLARMRSKSLAAARPRRAEALAHVVDRRG